jgi:hypothetical protein
MTSSPNQRLDRIERILDILSANQVAERDSRLELRDDLEILFQTVQQSTETTDRAIRSLTEQVNQLAGLMTEFARNAEADRAILRGIQTENRRILDHLFGQQGE